MTANLLQRAARTAKRRLDALAGVTGNYSNGQFVKEGLTAIPRLPGLYGQDVQSGALLTAEELDWVFTADELVLNGATVEPSEGDAWTFQREDGQFATYSVLPNESGRCFERSDHNGILLRVHTKLDRVEPPPQ